MELDEDAVSRNAEAFEVVDDSPIQVSLGFHGSTGMCDYGDVRVAGRLITIGRTHESMRLMSGKNDVSVVRIDVKRLDKGSVNCIHQRDFFSFEIGSTDVN